MRIKHPILAVVSILAIIFASGFQQPTEHRTDVPDHPWDLILSRPTKNSVTASLMVYTGDSEAFIEYGNAPGLYPSKTSVKQLLKGQPGTIDLTGLAANTRYYYRLNIRAAGATDYSPSQEFNFTTQRPPGSSFTFVMQADSHLDENTDPAIYAKAMENMLADNPDFLVDLGDTFMTDKYTAYKDAQKQYLAQRYYFGLLCPSAPLFLTLGNHDGEQGRYLTGTSDNMTIWSNAMRKMLFPNPVPDGFYTGNSTPDPIAGLPENYYAWEWGDALFMVLDPYWVTKRIGQTDNWVWTLGEAQYGWLKRTLESSRSRHKFVFIHHLVGGSDTSQRGGVEAAKFYEWGGYSSANSYDFPQKRVGWTLPIHQLLVKHRVSAVFHGHDHLYVKQDLDGIVYQEVPQPGYPRFNQANSATEYGYLSGVILGSPGHLRVTVTPDKVKVELVRPVLAKDETATRKNREIGHTYEIAATTGAVNVSAASYSDLALAPESIASVFGAKLCGTTRAASDTPLPTELAGTRISVRDSAGIERFAPLFYASPGQINYQVPQGTAPGTSSITITSDGVIAGVARVNIASVAPGIFTADATGRGYPAAYVLRYRGNEFISAELVAEFDPALQKIVPKPINFGPETETLFLMLFGTGLRNRGSLAGVAATIGGFDAQVVYAGIQNDYIGVDQINLRIPRELAGRGDADLLLTVDGVAANTVRVKFNTF